MERGFLHKMVFHIHIYQSIVVEKFATGLIQMWVYLCSIGFFNATTKNT